MLDRGLLFLLLQVVGVLGQECPVGKYGEDCQLNCSRSCAPYSGQDVHCDRHSGKCSEGCTRGWYGGQCQLSCSRNCQEHICSHQTGHCTLGCKGNNTGDFCETSPEGGPKEDTNEQLREPASTPLAAILVPVFAILLLIIIIITVAVLFLRHRQSDPRSVGVEELDLLNPGGDTDLQTQDTDLQTQDTDLHVACREGNVQGVRDILDQSLEDINKKGRGGMTPLMWAARRGHREVVDLLVRKEADLKLKDGSGNNVLHWACYGGHLAMVKHVISEKMVHIHSKGYGGRTALMWAAREGRRDFFEILVSEGGLPSQVDKEGNNILLLACYSANVEIVKFILSHADYNMDINDRGLSGRTPLMVAAYKGCGNIFELLVNKGANQELVDDVNNNVLHLACQGGNVDIVRRVLELGKVDKNSRGQCSRTPLMMAARFGHKETFDLLASEGADASLLDDEKNNILHLACEGGRTDMVEYVLALDTVNIKAKNRQQKTATMLTTEGSDVHNLLVSHGDLVDTYLHVACREGKLQAVTDILNQSLEDINKKARGGMTPLMWAARRGHREVVDLLVRKEAHLKLEDGSGNNVLHWACYGGHMAMVKHVISEKMVDIQSKGQGGRTALMWAAREGRRDFFEILVSEGGLPSQVDKEGNNILLLACYGANVEIVKSILSHADYNIDIDGRGLSGRTPLMVAAYKGCGNIFELLVNRGANQELADDVNNNVLHLACQGGNVDIVSRVLELGKVDKNSRGQCSRTPLMMAARFGHKEIFDLLVREGADASLLDCENNNILHLACEGGRIDMVDYVLALDIVNIKARNKRNETATMLTTEGGDVHNLLVSRGGLSE